MSMEIHLTPKYRLRDTFDIIKDVKSCTVTLRQLFDILSEAEEKNPGLCKSMGMEGFWRFYAEVIKTPPEKTANRLSSLELYWTVEPAIKVVNGKAVELADSFEMSCIMGIQGIGEYYCCDGSDQPPTEGNGQNNYGISFTPLNELANLPIRISTEATFGNNTVTIIPNLFTVISSIFWELTFYGDPSDRDERAATVDEIVQEHRRKHQE